MPDRPDHAAPRAVLLALVLACGSAWAAAPTAQADELDFGLFLTPLGRATTLRIDNPRPDAHGTFRVALALDYAHALLERGVACGGAGRLPSFCRRELRDRALVADLARADVSASVALYEVFELGLGIPVALARAAPAPDERLETNVGLADLRFGVGIALAESGGTHVAARFDTTWPTASARSLSGAGNWSVTPAVVFTHDVRGLTFAAKLGYHVRERVVVYGIEQDDDALLHLGAAFTALPRFRVITDVSARLGIGGRGLSRREVAVEVDVGARFYTGSSSFELAVGTNAVPTEPHGLAPAVRAVVGVRAAFEPGAPEPAPLDAATDSDRDGITDAEDACPFDREDRDGFADEDGCPDPDNDADGFVDARDACPERSEDSDGFQDRDGCPEADNDADGVADGADRCRMAPEDRDGFEDFDGCPEPGPARPVVTLSGSRSLVEDTIYFEGQADTISPASRPLLDELARTLQRLPSNKRVRVEGHTDDAGNHEHNIDLSYRRAKAVVEYLKARGVPASRLDYAGYGGQRPLADNKTPEGRALNRRVQFSLIDAAP